MLPNLDKVEQRFRDIETELMNPETIRDMKKFQGLNREHNTLKDVVTFIQQYRKVCADIEDHRTLLASKEDEELKNLARTELPELEKTEAGLEARIRVLLVPRDPNDDKNVIMEIRAGTGGDEAGIFAGDLFRMYSHFAENRKWKVEVMNTSPSEKGGFKEAVFGISGNCVYGELKFENGVHRVQRVPETEAQGRVHTSAASVVVMPEAEDVEVEVNPADLRVDVFRSSGPGGQSVNKTESAVRLTHVPTGIVVSCQDAKSQHKNRAKALKVLKTRILDAQLEKKQREDSVKRKQIVGTGDRSAKIRTYNFPQNRVTDHRINLTLYSLDRIMDGAIDELAASLKEADLNEKLQAMADTARPV